MKLIIKYLGTIILALVMLIAVFMVITPYFGWRFITATGSSMTPVLKSGCIVVIQPVEPCDIKLGDIIAYNIITSSKYNTVIIHRVVEIIEGDSLQFLTKGDANEDPDRHLAKDHNIIGRLYLYIPIIGQVVQSIKTPIGLSLFLLIPGLIIILMNVRDNRRIFTLL